MRRYIQLLEPERFLEIWNIKNSLVQPTCACWNYLDLTCGKALACNADIFFRYRCVVQRWVVQRGAACEGTRINVNSQNSVMETTGLGLSWCFKNIWWIVLITVIRMAMRSGATVAHWILVGHHLLPVIHQQIEAIWGSNALGQTLDTNAAFLPDSLPLIIAGRLDSKPSKSG